MTLRATYHQRNNTMQIDWAVYQLDYPFWHKKYHGIEETARKVYDEIGGTKRLVWLGRVVETNDERYTRDESGFYDEAIENIIII